MQKIYLGASPGDKTGTPARQAGAIINDNFELLGNEVFKDTVIKTGVITLAGLNVSIAANAFAWRINQVDFTVPLAFSATLVAASADNFRYDLLQGNTAGGYSIKQGIESLTLGTSPQPDVNHVALASILVLGAAIETTINNEPIDVFSKLDKGGYVGTAQDLDNAIKAIQLPDIILEHGDITLNGLNITINANEFQWRINQAIFNNVLFQNTIAPATSGFYRTDLLQVTSDNIIRIKTGNEDATSSTTPTIDPGFLALGSVNVFGNSIASTNTLDTSSFNVFSNGGPLDFTSVNSPATTLLIHNATSLTGFTIPSDKIQYGKDYYVRNSTGGPLTLRSVSGTNNIRFYFAEGDLVVPVNNNVHLKYLSNGEFGGIGYLTLVGVNPNLKVDKVLNKSLILDSEILRLSTVVNQDISVKADKLTTYTKLESDSLITQLLGGAPADGNTLKELNDKILAVQAIIGSGDADADAIVNTVKELLAVFATFPEGVDLVTLLAAKVNTTDVYNALDSIVAGRVLDARQGKVLNDLIVALQSGKQNALVSGTNIKTVGGVSILGTGNIETGGGGTGDMTLAAAQTNFGLKSFLSGTFGLRNIADTFTSFFTNSNTANRTYTLQNRNGTLADLIDIAAVNTGKMNTPTGTLNFLSKFLTPTTIGLSRLFDNGNFFGVGTENEPTKHITLGNQENKEIGIEESPNVVIGRNLILSAGRTINYVPNVNFNGLNQTTRNWRLITVHPNGNVYAAVISGDIFMQTNGTGNFISLGQTARNWFGITAHSNGNVYATVQNGDIFMQKNGTGDFISLVQTTRNWVGITAYSNGNVYATVQNGDIFMQTNGTGNFISLGQTNRNWIGITAHPNGNVYATVQNGDIFMQTNGTGNFISLGQTTRNWFGITAHSNGNVYAAVISGDIFMQTNGTGNFISLGQTAKNWIGITAHSNGNVYATVQNGDIFMQNNNVVGAPNLKGGNLQLKAGTGKGTGQSRLEIITGQKTASGTDMQLETVRATYDEDGNYTRIGTPIFADNASAITGGLLIGMEYRTSTGVKMEVF